MTISKAEQLKNLELAFRLLLSQLDDASIFEVIMNAQELYGGGPGTLQ